MVKTLLIIAIIITVAFLIYGTWLILDLHSPRHSKQDVITNQYNEEEDI